MRPVIYSMGVSLDGFIADPAGAIDWSVPDAELHRFHNEQAREVGVQIHGRRLYEAMRYWETAGEDPAAPAEVREFARIWRDTPRIVVSRTLERAQGGARLCSGDAAAELAALTASPGGPIAVGGAGLAATFAQADLIDEYRMFVSPVLLGGGTPYLPPLPDRLELELLETRTFGSRVVYLRYGRVR